MQAEMMLEILIVCIASAVSMVSAHKLLNSCNVESQKKACGTGDDQPLEELEAVEEHNMLPMSMIMGLISFRTKKRLILTTL